MQAPREELGGDESVVMESIPVPVSVPLASVAGDKLHKKAEQRLQPTHRLRVVDSSHVVLSATGDELPGMLPTEPPQGVYKGSLTNVFSLMEGGDTNVAERTAKLRAFQLSQKIPSLDLDEASFQQNIEAIARLCQASAKPTIDKDIFGDRISEQKRTCYQGLVDQYYATSGEKSPEGFIAFVAEQVNQAASKQAREQLDASAASARKVQTIQRKAEFWHEVKGAESAAKKHEILKAFFKSRDVDLTIPEMTDSILSMEFGVLVARLSLFLESSLQEDVVDLEPYFKMGKISANQETSQPAAMQACFTIIRDKITALVEEYCRPPVSEKTFAQFVQGKMNELDVVKKTDAHLLKETQERKAREILQQQLREKAAAKAAEQQLAAEAAKTPDQKRTEVLQATYSSRLITGAGERLFNEIMRLDDSAFIPANQSKLTSAQEYKETGRKGLYYQLFEEHRKAVHAENESQRSAFIPKQNAKPKTPHTETNFETFKAGLVAKPSQRACHLLACLVEDGVRGSLGQAIMAAEKDLNPQLISGQHPKLEDQRSLEGVLTALRKLYEADRDTKSAKKKYQALGSLFRQVAVAAK